MAGTKGFFVQPDPAADPFPMSGTAAPGPVDGTALTEGVDRYTPVGGIFDDDAVALTEGQGGFAKLTGQRAAHVNIRDSAGLEMGTFGNPLSNYPVTGRIPSYGFVTIITPAALPTDILSIQGSATKIVRIQRITITGSQTASGLEEFDMIRRSTANTGGTPALVGSGQLSSADAASTAVVTTYGTNPTVGTQVQYVRGEKVFIGTTGVQGGKLEWTWNQPGQRLPRLNGVGEFLCINMAGGTFTGGNLEICVELSEE